MTKEDDSKLDLELLADTARATLLKDGYHAPMLLIEGSQKNVVMQIDELASSHEGRAAQMFVIGLALSKQGEIGILQQVFFITEAWFSEAEDGKLPQNPPSKDPKRREVLLINKLDVPEGKNDMRILEMKRDKKGKLIRVEKRKALSEATQVESPLLAAFAMGFLGMSGKADD